jgi:hypothetical protein
MADPLSVAASIAGLVSLGIQVTQSLITFYDSYKSQDSYVARTTYKLESLLQTFHSLNKILTGRKFRADERALIVDIETSVQSCEDLVLELQEEFGKFSTSPTDRIGASIRTASRRLSYPLRQSTLQRLDENIGEIRENLSLALNVLELHDNCNIQNDTVEIKSLLNLVRKSQISGTVCDWLKAPDATINHNEACAKRHPGSGLWFVKGSAFTTWLEDDSSFLWLNGFAGCGKSVLSSTAIQYAFRHRRSDPCVGIAFFYFSFNDESKQDVSGMIRAILYSCPASSKMATSILSVYMPATEMVYLQFRR